MLSFFVGENPQIVWGFGKAFSFKLKIKTPFNIIFVATARSNNILKGGHLFERNQNK